MSTTTTTTHIIQWLVFRGVGHAQTGVNPVVETLPVVACGRTSWPGIYRYSQYRPKHVCPECAAAVGLAPTARTAAVLTTDHTDHTDGKGSSKPSQGQLF